MKLFYSIILALFLVQSLQGQELYGKYLNHEQGLLSSECYDIGYDENGYLIVGTPYGPMKYNGEKFIAICTNISMEHRIMYDFEKDARGTVYMSNSKNELFRLQDDKGIPIRIKNRWEFTKYKLVFNKLYCKDGALYICTHKGFLKYSFRTKKVSFNAQPTAIKTPGKRIQPQIFEFVYNSRDSFPFYKCSPLMARKDGKASVKFPESNQKFVFQGFRYDSRESVLQVRNTTYLLICMKLFKRTGDQYNPLNFKDILFFESFHNRIWLCTLDGLIELDLEGNFIDHHFKGEVIGGVVPLKTGGIAISFNQKGVFISPNIHNRIHYDLIPTAAAKINGMNLLGNSRGELFKYSNYKLEKLLKSDPFNSQLKRSNHDAITGIHEYKNHLLLTFFNGISVLTKNFKKVKEVKDPRNSHFGTITDRENILFYTRGALLKINWNKLNTLPFPYDAEHTPTEVIYCHIRLNSSTFLLGTNAGLVQYSVNTNQFSEFKAFKKEVRITDITRIDKDKFFVCTRFDGIYLFDRDQFVRKITTPCTVIASSLFYRGQIIIRGNDGIYISRLNQTNPHWFKFFSGETAHIFILDKNILISYKNDLIIKRLSDYKLSYKPVIVLNKCMLGNRQLRTFPYSVPSDSPISVDVDILQFDANKFGLYYQLKGENTISQQIEGTKINFDALKSGSYVLKIHPVIDGKIQFNNSKTFRFTIEKTFWESTVFYILSGILILSIVVTSILIIHLRRRKRKAERSELESRLNEYKLLAVKAQVNPHFLSNGLAAIQALILKEDNDLAAQYLAKFSFLMRKTLYYSEKQFITAKQELELVDAYLELELLRFRNRFVIRREIKLSKSQLKKFQFPSLLLQPILENAIWHGLKFQENNPELHILLEINQNNELLVRISDNGPGFNESTKSEEHLSKGNQLITDRIDALNVQFQKNVASIEVITSSSGTTITFIFHPEVYQPTEQ